MAWIYHFASDQANREETASYRSSSVASIDRWSQRSKLFNYCRYGVVYIMKMNMKMMRPVCCLAVLLFVIAPGLAAEVVTVEDACRRASETYHGLAYDHCVASLAADPRSKEEEAGSMHGLAVLATKLAIDHAAGTVARMDDLAELAEGDSSAPQARARFNHCLEQYGGAADLLRDALDNLKAQIYGKAMEELAAALGASESCEDAWKGEEELHRVPVAAHDREYGRMAHIALGFTHAAA